MSTTIETVRYIYRETTPYVRYLTVEGKAGLHGAHYWPADSQGGARVVGNGAPGAPLGVALTPAQKQADDLLFSLKCLVDSYCYWLPRYGDPEAVNSEMIRKARETIANAEGRK